MSNYLDELNKIQYQAVTTSEGPVMVIAGPGSGKTRVLTYRIAHLIDKGVPAHQILSLTFTNKAAREMKERIEKVVGAEANKLWAGTFHSIFARILRIEAEKIGYPSSFTIYDSDDSKSVISGIIKDLSLDPKTYNANGIRSRISMAKSNLITPKRYVQLDELMVQDQMNRQPYIHKIYDMYMKRCFQAGAMDFDDLLLQLFRLLQENPDEVRQKYQKKFTYVLVDEFQDTNSLQYSILKKLKKYPGSDENLCIVGDDAQSIYAFRGATIDNILNFEKDFPKAKIYKLEQNYRSTKPIVQAANEVIQYNKRQIQKKIWTEQYEGEKIKVIRAVSDTEEGRRIADAILEHKNRYHIPNKEIAILYRTNAQSRVFEEHLRRHNITYRIVGGLSFYQRKEIKDLLAYLRLAVNPKDAEAFKRAVNQPKRGIGATTMNRVLQYAQQQGCTLWEAAQIANLPAGAKKKLAKFIRMIEGFREKANTYNAYDAVLQIYKQSGLHDMLQNDHSIEGQGRIENVSALLDGIQEFIENDEVVEGQDLTDRSLAAYLQNIALLTDFDKEEDTDDYVTLMSVHAAKGLEFISVFIVGLEEKLFPSFMALEGDDSIDEERRLFYVAITRAKKYLTLSFANSRYQYGQVRYNAPSRFLEEISEEWMDISGIRGWQTQQQLREPQVSRVGGMTKPKPKIAASAKQIDPSTFSPSPMHKIRPGQTVLHMKFGEGKVQKIDGSNDKKVATIYFNDIDQPERRIMLKFAKLQIVDS